MFNRIKRYFNLITLNYVLSHNTWSKRRKAYEVLKIISGKKIRSGIHYELKDYKFILVGNNILELTEAVNNFIEEYQANKEALPNNKLINPINSTLSDFFTQSGYYLDMNKCLNDFIQASINLCLLTESNDNIYKVGGAVNYRLTNYYITILNVGELLLKNNLFE